MRLAVMVTLLLALAAPARAQESGHDAEARALFVRGRQAFEAGDHQRAAILWEEAYELSWRSELLFNVGNARLHNGELEAAAQAYRRYLELEGEDAVEREAAEERLVEIAARAPTGPRPRGPFDDRIATWVALGTTLASGASGTGLLVDASGRCGGCDGSAVRGELDAGNALIGTAVIAAVATVVIWFVEGEVANGREPAVRADGDGVAVRF